MLSAWIGARQKGIGDEFFKLGKSMFRDCYFFRSIVTF